MADQLDRAWEALTYYGVEYEDEPPELVEEGDLSYWSWDEYDDDYEDWHVAWEAA